MENDSSTIFYIIAVVVYFLYSLFFRKKEQEPVEGNPNSPDAPKKPVSFEDLLKEIRQEQGEVQREVQEVEDVWEGDEDDYEEEHEVLKETSYERPYREEARYYEGSWESKNRYSTHPTQPLVKLEDQVELTASDIVLGEVEEEQEPGRSNNRFGLLLKNPETLKDAVVVSEILTRKHF